jgi:GNAT superfamily N-acetyltransferase
LPQAEAELIFALETVTQCLPPDLGELRMLAAAEGFRMLERLADEWHSGEHRFDRPGEALLTARIGSRMAGIGGMTIDRDDETALRLRRFYIAPDVRRHGVGRGLALALIRRPECQGRRIVVNAGTAAAPAFWEAHGFVRPGAGAGHTHVLANPPGALSSP